MYAGALAMTLIATYMVAAASEKLIEHRFIEYGRMLIRQTAHASVQSLKDLP
jgi:hypothetical protein